ncbi:VanW family protein [Candidatus Gottesmanbacteria bacterium]|nr:VanW family protein [Candidatus Gottesmanbacteria bacterium]
MGWLKHKLITDSIIALGISAVIIGIGLVAVVRAYDAMYAGRVYPSVMINGTSFGGKTSKDVEEYWIAKNEPFEQATFTFVFESHMATISGTELGLGYDATISATQAYLVGRSGNFLSDTLAKFSPSPITLTPLFRFREDVLSQALDSLKVRINIPVQDALFEFRGGKVTAFRPSKEGREVNIEETNKRFSDAVTNLPMSNTASVVISLLVHPVKPSLTTDRVNAFGIKELIGRGYSEFAHSIPGRVHNVALASAKIHGLLIKPGDTFSFNDALGDVSAATGFQPAYVIKEGRTVLGDGGGVCQVSTTLFRAALSAGLPIVERRAHAYRVAYYEQAGYKAGLDATVFAPSVDLKIKNDTPGYILIQAKTDTRNMTLTFELYGTSDGRKAEIYNHVVGGITPPPPDLYQDDPTLPVGVVKQVDFSAWGAKASFQYKVTRNGEVLQDSTFVSNFRPWQAVYLRGTTQ